DGERLVAVRFDGLAEAGAALRALLASDLIPNAVDLLDAASAAALGLPPNPATLAIGFDGLGEQVDWQIAELAGVVVPCGGAKPALLGPQTWPRLASAARDAFDAPAALMTLSVLPGVVVDTLERGGAGSRARGARTPVSATGPPRCGREARARIQRRSPPSWTSGALSRTRAAVTRR